MTETPFPRANDTRQKIIQSALELFVSKGVTETSIRDIASRAGVAEGSIYRHFSNKEALAYTLFADNFTSFAETLEALLAEKNTTAEKLAAMIHGFCALFDQDQALFSFLLLAQHQEMQKLPVDAPNPVNVVARVIAEGIARHDIAMAASGHALDVELATAMVMGVVLQTATFRIYGRLDQPMSTLADQITAAALRVLVQNR